MTKIAIKNENITSFGGIYNIMDVFSKFGFEKLSESVLGKRGSSRKAYSYGSVFSSLFFGSLCGVECLEGLNTLIGQFKQRLGTHLISIDYKVEHIICYQDNTDYIVLILRVYSPFVFCSVY